MTDLDLERLVGELRGIAGQLAARLPPGLADAVQAWAAARGVELTSRPDLAAMRFVVDGARGPHPVYLVARDQPSQVLCYVPAQVEIDPDVRSMVGELLARINWSLDVAHVELNWGTRELRSRVGLDVAGERVTPAMIDRLVANAIAPLERYHDALVAVGDGSELPHTAFAAAAAAD